MHSAGTILQRRSNASYSIIVCIIPKPTATNLYSIVEQHNRTPPPRHPHHTMDKTNPLSRGSVDLHEIDAGLGNQSKPIFLYISILAVSFEPIVHFIFFDTKRTRF